MYSTSFTHTRLVLDSSGELQFWIWFESVGQWKLGWWKGRDGCDTSSKCGANSICSNKKSPVCDCLQGFEPASPANWNMGDWRDGCHRKEALQCGKESDFWPLSKVYIPESSPPLPSRSTEKCREACLADCSCNAYASYQDSLERNLDPKCHIWVGDLFNILDEVDNGGSTLYGFVDRLYLRIPPSESSKLLLRLFLLVHFLLLLIRMHSFTHILYTSSFVYINLVTLNRNTQQSFLFCNFTWYKWFFYMP